MRAAPIRAGDVLDQKFRVDRVVSNRSTGVMVTATHIVLGSRVSLQVPSAADGPEAGARLVSAVGMASKIQSDHVARVNDVGTLPDGRPYVIFECLEGLDLEHAVKQRGPLPVDVAVRYAIEACEVLGEAHALGLVHGGLRSGSFVLADRPDGKSTLKVLGFGVSSCGASSTDVRGVRALDLLCYTAPEQLRGDAEVGPAADLWSLGVVLHELLTGESPFGGPSAAHVREAVLSRAPTPLREIRPSVPAELEALVLHCLQKDPNARPENAKALAAALASCSPAAPESPVQPGEILADKYRVDEVLGVGGMGIVVAATHILLEQKIALKFLLAEHAGSDEHRERFAREARAVARLQSDHVARVLDVGTLESGTPFIVMEYLEGHDLGQLLKNDGQLPVADVLRFVIEACGAIGEAHLLGIVHRDLKPANLFLARRPGGGSRIKVLDFGISKVDGPGTIGEANTALTKTSAVMGSPMYMSPEQLRASRDVDARSDIWALGIILYELLSGDAPFSTGTVAEICAAVLKDTPVPLANVRDDVPPALEDVILRCLEKDPQRRFSSVDELGHALAPFLPPDAIPEWVVRARAKFERDTIAPPPKKPLKKVSAAPARAESPSVADITTIPRLRLTPEELQEQTLDNRAGFLLACIDGESTTEQVLDVAAGAMPREEAVSILKSLERDGVVLLAPAETGG